MISLRMHGLTVVSAGAVTDLDGGEFELRVKDTGCGGSG
jgi:hypothetical protein